MRLLVGMFKAPVYMGVGLGCGLIIAAVGSETPIDFVPKAMIYGSLGAFTGLVSAFAGRK